MNKLFRKWFISRKEFDKLKEEVDEINKQRKNDFAYYKNIVETHLSNKACDVKEEK